MAELIELPINKKKYLLSRDNENTYFAKLKLKYIIQYGWVLKYGLIEVLTSSELRHIANKLDQLNKRRGTSE